TPWTASHPSAADDATIDCPFGGIRDNHDRSDVVGSPLRVMRDGPGPVRGEAVRRRDGGEKKAPPCGQAQAGALLTLRFHARQEHHRCPTSIASQTARFNELLVNSFVKTRWCHSGRKKKPMPSIR